MRWNFEATDEEVVTTIRRERRVGESSFTGRTRLQVVVAAAMLATTLILGDAVMGSTATKPIALPCDVATTKAPAPIGAALGPDLVRPEYYAALEQKMARMAQVPDDAEGDDIPLPF